MAKAIDTSCSIEIVFITWKIAKQNKSQIYLNCGVCIYFKFISMLNAQ